jgi:AcrR family transcriptional regulator
MTEGESTRARIVRVSADLFARQGYHGTGLTELLAATGLGKGGFYHHIASKDDLLLEIMLEPINRALYVAEAITASPLPAEEKLTALGRELGGSMGEDLSAWTVFLREYSSLSEDNKAQVLALRRAYLDHWRSVLTEGMASGTFRTVDLSFVESVFGLFIYTFVWDDKGATKTELTDAVMNVLIHGVRAEATPDGVRPVAAEAGNGRAGSRSHTDRRTAAPACEAGAGRRLPLGG